MDISERKKKILAAVVDDYIETAEPVGSKAISQKAGLGLSSATIRNEMAELEAMGYLEQPHTSAGRIPSPQGYRLYVNELMRRQKLSLEETEKINRSLRQKMQQLDHLIADVGRLASALTLYPAYALTAATSATITRFDFIYVDANTFIIVAMLGNDTVKNRLVHLPFTVEQETIRKLSTVFNANFTNIPEQKITQHTISSAEKACGDTVGLVAAAAGFAIEILSEVHSGSAYITGTSNLLQHPEYRDPDKAQRLMDFLSDSDRLLELPPIGGSDIQVLIGPENVVKELQDSSVVMAGYNIGDNMRGLIGVVGPTRMDYSKVAAKLSYLVHGLSRVIGGEQPLPEPKQKGDEHSHEQQEERQTSG